jgi:RNA polymerase sigma factor (sigma-70 family)
VTLRDECVRRSLQRLPENERRVIALRYGMWTDRRVTLSELGSQLGVSHEWIRRLEQRALDKLATLPEAQPLRISA